MLEELVVKPERVLLDDFGGEEVSGVKEKSRFPELVTVVAALCFTAACSARDDIVRLDGATMGTFYSVQFVRDRVEIDFDRLAADIDALLDGIDSGMSTYRNDSELMRFNANQGADWVDISDDLATVLDESLRVSRLTDGAFDVTVGPLVNLWGFGPHRAANSIPSATDIEQQQGRVGYQLLTTRDKPPGARKERGDVFVDLSAVAKGFAVDRLASLLDQAGFRSYLVEIGGELRASGVKPGGSNWMVAIEQPASDARRVQRTLALRNQAIATSGDYRNFFEIEGQRYSHVIDPRTGWPVTHAVVSVTVVCPSAMTADAFATALLVLGEEDGFKVATDHRIAALFLLRNGDHFSELTTPEFERFLARERPYFSAAGIRCGVAPLDGGSFPSGHTVLSGVDAGRFAVCCTGCVIASHSAPALRDRYTRRRHSGWRAGLF